MAGALFTKLQGLIILTTIAMMTLFYHLPHTPMSSTKTNQIARSMIVISEHQHDGQRPSVAFAALEHHGILFQKKQIGRRDEAELSSAAKRNNTVSWMKTCDSQCEAFRSVMKSWPADRPKAAFYYLTQLSRINLLAQSLASVDLHFNNRYQYPVIIFHEGDLNDRVDDIRNMTTSQVFFQLVQFSIPEFLSKPIPLDIPCLSSLSYRHMCRFHARVVYEEPIIGLLQYYWRLDDDSLLLSDVAYDVFKFMDRKALQYGYLWRHWDSFSCIEGLWEATQAYISERNIKTEFFGSWKKGWLYYNNFEIASTKMWLSNEYKSYIDYIDRLGGIFYKRWGDAPLHGIAVSMFIPKNETYLFRDIGYKHGWYRHEAVSSNSE